MPVQREFDHADHNEAVAKKIHADKSSTAWVIIISFYSALHYVRGKIFPFNETINGKTVTVQSFDGYCVIHNGVKKSKHDKLYDLVTKHLPSIQAKYKWLLDSSITARYNDYHFDPSFSQKSIDYLDAIKKECK
ncbi:MAG: hypothetical protein AB1728_13330 [Bacteroidota bacterium]